MRAKLMHAHDELVQGSLGILRPRAEVVGNCTEVNGKFLMLRAEETRVVIEVISEYVCELMRFS